MKTVAHRRIAAALALLLAAPLAVPAAVAQPALSGEADAEAPAGPAGGAPSPADLSAAARPALPADIANLPLGPDFTRLPAGGWRLGGRSGRGEPEHGARLAIETIGRYLAEQTSGRVTVLAQAAGPEDDPSVARRTSLARAITVKQSLTRGGLPGTRIDLRPLGRTDEEADAIDIIAPPRARPRDTAAAPPPAAPTSSAPRGG